MSSAKTLIRSGISLMRCHVNPILTEKSIYQSAPQSFEIAPKLFVPHQTFPSLLKFQRSVDLAQSDANAIHKASSEALIYPCRLPYLQFFLPDDDSISSEPLLCIKRTYQPNNLRHKSTQGYLARKATKGGRRVIARRIAKGRFRITA